MMKGNQMGGVLGVLLSSVVSVIIPVLVSFMKTKMPQASRADARAWVKGLLDEVVQGLNSHGLVPAFLQPLEDPIESLFAQQIDAALDKVGW